MQKVFTDYSGQGRAVEDRVWHMGKLSEMYLFYCIGLISQCACSSRDVFIFFHDMPGKQLFFISIMRSPQRCRFGAISEELSWQCRPRPIRPLAPLPLILGTAVFFQFHYALLNAAALYILVSFHSWKVYQYRISILRPFVMGWTILKFFFKVNKMKEGGEHRLKIAVLMVKIKRNQLGGRVPKVPPQLTDLKIDYSNNKNE